MIIDASREVFEEITKNETRCPVLVDFWAPWCSRCKALSSILEELDKVYGRPEGSGLVQVIKVNVEEEQEFCKGLEIMSLPVMLFYDKGKQVSRIEGMATLSMLVSRLELYKE